MNKHLSKIWKFLTYDIWRITEDEVTRTTYYILTVVKTISLCINNFTKDRLVNKASALTYSTLLAIVPIMAIVFAISFYRKEIEINLLLLGRIKLIYLALFTFVIDLLAMTSDNAGGHIAHIGGAFFGIWFASRYAQGKDLTAPINRLIDKLVNLGKRKPKMSVTYGGRSNKDWEYNARKQQQAANIDAILDKLKRSGYGSLSADEKKQLFDASKK